MSWWTVSPIIMVLVGLCSTVELNCTCLPLSCSGKQVTYSLDRSLLPGNKSTCKLYSWATGNDVIATHLNQIKEVMTKSLDSLQTSECLTELSWKAQCTSEKTGFLEDFTANCSSSCKQNEFLHKDKGGHSTLWTLLLIPAVLLALGLLYKCRKKICSGSTPSCGQCGGLYTAVKTQHIHLEPVGVVVNK